MAIHRLQGPDGQIHLVEAPDDADPNQLISVVQQQIDAENRQKMRREAAGFLETAGQGVARGFKELVSTGKNVIPALGASLFGFDEYAKEKLEQAKKEQQDIEAQHPPLFKSYKEIEGLGDFGKFVTEKTSEQLANILTSLVPGMGLGAVASRGAATAIGKGLATQAAEKGLAGAAAKQFVEKELTEEAARKAIAGSTLRGEMTGAFLGSYALNAPEVFQNIYENNDKQLAPVAAALFSIGSAALDSILPARLSSQLPNPFKAAIVGKVLENSGMEKSLVANITTSALKAAGIEGLTEGAQEAISIAAERFVSENPKVFGSKEWNRIMESAVAGAVSGGAFGSIGGSTQGLRARAEAKRQEAAEARARGDEERAKQFEAEADAASAEIEKLQRQTTPEERDIYGVSEETGPYSPAQAFGPITPKEFKEQETQFKKDQQTLRERLEELSPESYVKEGMPGLVTKKGQLDLVSQAERPTPIEQTLQKAVSPLEQLQERGMRQGELGLEQMRQIGWKEEWNTLVPNIAELAQPEFRKALASDVTIPVETRKGIIAAAKKATLPNGAPIVPRVVKYSYPVESTLMDDLRLRSKDVFGFSPSASVWKKLEGLDAKNPEHVPLIRSAFSEFAEKNPGRATKIEQYLDRLPPTPKLIEGAPDVTGLDQPPSGGGAGVLSKRGRRPASAAVESTKRGRVDFAPSNAGQPVVGEVAESGALAPEVQRAVNFVRSVEAGGIPLNPAKIRTIAQDLGLEVKKTARPEETIQRIREAVGRATEQPQVAPAQPAPTPAAPQLTPEQEARRAEAEFLGEEQLPIEERGAMIRRKERRELTPEELRATPTEDQQISEVEAGAPVEPISNKELRKIVKDFFGAHYLDPEKKMYLPKYEGPAFDETQRRLAESGDINGLIRNLLDSNKDPAIKQVLRRIRSLNLNTKLEIVSVPIERSSSGFYDPVTDTVGLDPTNGLNAHTFVHEVLHAAVSKVLFNKNHPLTKEFEKFFVSVKDRLGDAYGGTDLQEFAAELISNPSFQSLLKSIKAPRSESMFMNILRKIAEFFGFAKESTAFTQGLKFIDAAIDISGNVEAAAGERMFLTGDFAPIKDINNAMPSLVGRTIENTRNALSNLTGSSFQEAAFGMLQLGNLKQLFSKELPSISVLQSALERRAGRQEMEANRINNNYKRFAEVQQRFPEQMETLGDIAIKASQAEVDILKPYEATTADPAKRVTHGTLQAQFKKLDPEVQDVYKTARKDYDDAFKQYRKIIEDAAENMPGLAVKLKEEFERAHPLVGYTPFLRYGDFWLEFVNPQTDAPVAMSFESIRERDQFIEQNLKGIDHQKYQNFDEVQFNAARVPPTHFISKIITGLRQSNASEAQVNAVYQAYLAAFPAESMAKQFIKRRGIEGMEKDFVRGYGNLMLRWSQKLNNSEFLPQIDKALSMIAQEARNQPPDVAAAAKSILRQTDFFHNPTYNSAVRNATAISYYEYMAGNISSGIVNLTSLPLMVFPILSGRFGFSAPGALLSAIKTALPGNNWQNDPKYKDLYQRLMDHGQLEHTLAREVLEGRRKKTQDYTGLTAKITDLVSLPFSVSEKWNRASTAIAAYNLELAKTGDKEKAINYALETVRIAHTSGMAVTSPRWMQTAPGRIFFTFKSIIWQQAYVIARAFHQAVKGESKEIRDAARAQLLSTYGMATVFLGVKGMPFYGALSTLIQMLNALFGDDDEPFNLDELLNKTLPMWLNKGLVNYAFNVELSKRAAIANDLIFRDDPRGIAEHGYVLSAMQQAFGPIGSILINSERSFKLFKDGQYYRAFEAASPATIRNGLKGIRYLTEGALTLKGDPIDTDISTYNGLMQVIGFAPADLSDLYEELAIAKQYETAVKARRKFLLRTYEMASRAADDDLLMEVADKIQKFNEANPRISITSDTLARSRRATIAAQQSSIHGVRFDKKLLPEIKQRFFEEE